MLKNRQKALVFTLLLFSTLSLYGQGRLELKIPRIYITGATGVVAFTGGYLYSNSISGLNIQQLSSISTNTLNSFDRRATENYSNSAKTWSDITAITTAALPGFLSMHSSVRKDFVAYNTIYSNALLTTVGEVLLLKAITKRNRPFVYNPNVPLSEKLENNARFSFPSGHTAVAATASYFFATTYSIYFPKSKYKKWVWVGAAILPIVTGFLRYKAGRHFVSDIAGGYVIGASNGILFPLLFKERSSK